MQQIKNRRFMFSPQTGELILGKQYKGRQLYKSHAEEHAESGATAPFDSFIRGWIGVGKEYPQGVIHFAPHIESRNAELFDRAFDTLEAFARNGAKGDTVIRGFGNQWEQPFRNIIPSTERSKRMSDFDARPFELTATDTEGRVKEMTERLEAGVKELFESERYQAYLRAMSKFHDYSLNNTLLILLQKPDASLVAGFNKWRDDFERHVKAEEKGIKIFAPAHKKIRKEVEKLDPDTGDPIIGEDGKPVMETKEITIPRYKVVSVFDVSQTDGKEIPDMSVDALTGSIEQYEDFWRALKEISPVPVELEKIEGGAHGYYSLADKRIAIDDGMSELQTIKTLIHEIAHAKLHDIDLSLPPQDRQERPNQRTREVEAESIAYTVCQHFGLETSEYSFGYIAGWSSDKEIAELKASLETIRQTASELIGEIEGRFAELTAQREAVQDSPERIAEDLFDLMRDFDPDYMRSYENDRAAQVASTVDSLKTNDTAHIEMMLGITRDDAGREEVRQRAAALLDRVSAFKEQNNTFSIYQVRGGDDTRDYRFESLESLKERGLTVDRANYELVYSAPLHDIETLESIYQRFNNDHPEDFTGHSLSVSDVVVLRHGEQETAHYCDSVGFAEVPEFLQEQAAQRETPQEEQGAAYRLDDGTYLYVQASDTGYDYTLYDSDMKDLDGGQLDNPDLSLSAARDEIFALHELHPAAVENVALDDFEQMRQRSEPLPPSLDPAVQPVVTIIWSESPKIEDGEQMPLVRADALFKALDEEKRVEREKPGYEGSWYDKTKFRIDFTFQGERDNYEGRQDFGDGDGSLIDHIRGYHEYYANNESHKNYVLRNGGAEAWEQEKAQTDMLLHEFVPYLELHRNLSEQERSAAGMLEAEILLTPKQTSYFNAVLSHVDACREKLNSGDYDLPDPPQLADFDKELQNYKAHVEDEIAQEAAAADMTVEEYAANGYEPVTQEEAPEQAQEKAAVRYYPIHEEAARRANDANSFRDYKPGSATAEYRRMVDHAAELAQEQKGRVDPMYHDKIDALLDTYARRLAENMNKHYDIEARVPSVIIAGSSNFPVRKKEKQNAARDRNMQEWQDVQGLLDKIRSTGMGGISADDPQAVQKLEAKLANLIEAQENMKAINAYYRKHGTLDGCTILPEKQIKALQQDMKSSWHLEPKPFQSYELSNNNAEIRRTRARIEELKRHEEKEYSGWTFDGGRVEANKEANRLQIFFDGKPDEATREELKANGFRWAPSVGAWQRQLNSNAYRAAGYIPAIQPIAVEPPAPDASLTGQQITTPRGSFLVTALSREQMEAAGYGVHHPSEDGKYFIMGNGTQAYAVAVAPPENYLKNAEMSTEQNYNMIDGQINNTPTVDELEEKAKRGELILLTALAAAVKAEDGRTPQREPDGKKPSIRAQLKADKARAAAQPKQKQQEQDAKRSVRQALEME